MKCAEIIRKNIFGSDELDRNATISIVETVQKENKVCSILEHTTAHGAEVGKKQTQRLNDCNFDAVISVGYRVNFARATQCRMWATQLIH